MTGRNEYGSLAAAGRAHARLQDDAFMDYDHHIWSRASGRVLAANWRDYGRQMWVAGHITRTVSKGRIVYGVGS